MIDAEFHATPLWAFALAHYAKTGVKEACLALQDAHGLDVNVAMACLWVEQHGVKSLSPEDITMVLERTTDDRNRVLAIRPLRRQAKAVDGGAALYRTLKRAELLAENLLHRALFEALKSRPDGAGGNGRSSLCAYATSQGQSLPPALLDALTSS